VLILYVEIKYKIQLGKTRVHVQHLCKNGCTRNVRIEYRHTFQEVTVPYRTIHRTANKLKQYHYWTRNMNQNAECSFKKKWMKLALGLNMFLRNASDSLCRRMGVSNLSPQTNTKLRKL
jgi:hypothetical protein